MSEQQKGNLGDELKDSANEFKESWNQATKGGENKKLLAGILAILLGGLGIHKFILGYTKEGVMLLVGTLVLGVITCGLFSGAVWVITLIEGIIYLTKSDEEFYQTYQVGRRPWF